MTQLITQTDCYGNSATIPVDQTTRVTQCEEDPAIRVCMDDGTTIANPNIPDGNTYTGIAVAAGYPDKVMSVTIAVFVGAVTITTTTGIVTVPTGATFSWGNGDNKELDMTAISFAGVDATASYVLVWEA